MKNNIPQREDIIHLIENLLQEYPPTMIPSLIIDPRFGDNTIKAYKEIIGEYPELLLYQDFWCIYLPGKTAEQIADEILDPEILNQEKKKEPNRERSRQRGLSQSNKLLADVAAILSDPVEFIKRHKCKLDESKFSFLLRIAHKLREDGKSIDQYFTEHQCSDDIRKLIAVSLVAIYEACIMFRTELYKAYEDKAKTIRKMPEMDEYYEDVQRAAFPVKGKQATKETISRDAEEYREYIRGASTITERDRRFYDAKRFRYNMYLVTEIANFFEKEVTEPENLSSPFQDEAILTCPFSIDAFIDKELNKPRHIFGVGLITLPAVKTQ